MPSTTFVIVHYRTPKLIRQCHASIREFYPDFPVIVVDGGSTTDTSTQALKAIAGHERTTVLFKSRNIGHGPGLHEGIKKAGTPYVLTMDSDCIVQRGGFVEIMIDRLRPQRVYACGKLVHVNRYGQKIEQGGLRYVRPVTALWDRNVYLSYPPFDLHGAPCLRNELYAARDGWRVESFPVDDYVLHLQRRTREKHGCHWTMTGPVV
jgi:glycosyltransferase involved in cell wall biosynthesis